MVLFYGRQWSKQELLRQVGHMDQLAGIKLVEAADGIERGVRTFQVWTGTGLTFNVLADRALDISACRYKEFSLAWQSSSGDVHPAYYEADGLGWLRSFQGGLLATCGLDQFGSPGADLGENFGQHGRVGSLPARYTSYRTYWDGDEYVLEISGEVRQTRIFGENLVLRRRLVALMGSNQLCIEDTVTNEGFQSQPHMILYHFNLGFPLVSADSELHLQAKQTVPRDKNAESGLNNWHHFQSPTAGYAEQVFRHKPQAGRDGWAQAELKNPKLNIGFRLLYDTTTLPHLFQWKMMGEGTYVVGIEPANSSGIGGRAVARQINDLPYLEPGESRAYSLTVEIVDYKE